MRGEHPPSTVKSKSKLGSSPHARGARAVDELPHLRVGIIPACAGSTCSPNRAPRGRRDHPRMRGEHVDTLDDSITLMGSSPHARGARHTRHTPGGRGGIIPACAGSTCGRTASPCCRRDHPRMRGEHPTLWMTIHSGSGSSPHARGALHEGRARLRRGGIIPACAGSTTRLAPPAHAPRDHPRMRGEHRFSISLSENCQGSSPHARGAHQTKRPMRRSLGIIPACAGSTVRTVAQGLLSVGSSPHARGARGGKDVEWRVDGIIPACAGSTFPSRCS